MTGRTPWLPGAGLWRSGRRRRATVTGTILLSQAILWLVRGTTLGPALLGRSGADLGLAAWFSLLLVGAAWWAALPGAGLAPDHRSPGPWRGTWRRLVSRRRDAIAVAGLFLLLILAVEAPVLAPFDPDEIGAGPASHHLPPLSRLHLIHTRDGGVVAASAVEFDGDAIRFRRGDRWTRLARSALRGTRPGAWHEVRLHLLGTDHLGRDLLSRILLGSRFSLSVGLLAALLAAVLGAAIGGTAGWAGPRLDGLLMRATDAALSIPTLFLVLMVLAVVPGSFIAVVIVLGATGWMGPSRLVRAEVRSLRHRPFVEAARVIGRRGPGLIGRHLLPNALAPLLVATTLRVGQTILLEAGLSFLGLGVPPPHATWGNIISGGRPALIGAWWVATFPGLALVTAVVLFNLVGDGVRQALAPE
ncbi:MAG: ABC transporter permease [Acidobacteriota bacterium]